MRTRQQARVPAVIKDSPTSTWTVFISVLNDDGYYRPHKLCEGFDSEDSARTYAGTLIICPTCDGSGSITLQAAGEVTPAACIDCNGERVKQRA